MTVEKRAFDVVLLFLVLPIWFPVLISLSCANWFLVGSPILFRQDRAGIRGNRFSLLKFRTMTKERDAQGLLKPDNERITPYGKWLRSTSLDELPELLNILKGEMTLVGPRPLHLCYNERYSDRQRRRLGIVPGLTGWAQINGRNSLSWDERFELDVWYVENQTFWLDLRILWLTIWKVLSREGISADGEGTMPEFQGPEENEKTITTPDGGL